MSKYIIIIISVLVIAGVSFSQSSGFGLGIIIGEPTGITGKYWTSETGAIDGAAAWAFSHDGGVHLHADYLYHKFGLIKVQKGSFPLYYGIGGRLQFHHHHHDNDDLLGVRVPVGLDYLFASDPFDIFFEVVPILDIVPDTDFSINAAIGFRYFFK
jgi:hypothetical protein